MTALESHRTTHLVLAKQLHGKEGRERERDRDRVTKRYRDIDREIQRQRETERDREMKTERERERDVRNGENDYLEVADNSKLSSALLCNCLCCSVALQCSHEQFSVKLYTHSLYLQLQ